MSGKKEIRKQPVLTFVRPPTNTKLSLPWGPYELQLNFELEKEREQRFYRTV